MNDEIAPDLAGERLADRTHAGPGPPSAVLRRATARARVSRPMSRRRQPSRMGMAKVLTRTCMSLDVFVAHPDDNRARHPENEGQER